jgi:hypothetical protein
MALPVRHHKRGSDSSRWVPFAATQKQVAGLRTALRGRKGAPNARAERRGTPGVQSVGRLLSAIMLMRSRGCHQGIPICERRGLERPLNNVFGARADGAKKPGPVGRPSRCARDGSCLPPRCGETETSSSGDRPNVFREAGRCGLNAARSLLTRTLGARRRSRHEAGNACESIRYFGAPALIDFTLGERNNRRTGPSNGMLRRRRRSASC